MAEFNLICPGCGAEYALPPDAIPPAGREVECSSCGHIWQAHPPAAPEGPLDLGSFPRPRDALAPRLMPAKKRLSADVMDILQAEVDHERRQRDADQQADVRPTTDEIEWPATTVITPSGTEGPLRPAPVMPAPGPTVIRHAQARATQSPPPPPRDTRPVAQPDTPPQLPVVAKADGRTRYRVGLTLALLIAVCVVAVYLLAPVLAPKGGPLADRLIAWRADLDGLRLWLAATAQRIAGT